MRVGRLANVLLAGASICTPLFLAGCDEASSGDVDTTFLATTASTTFVDGIDSTSTTGEVVTPESTTPGSTSTTSTPRTPPTPRTLAGDAQFLLHASFGPTRASLDALQSKDYESWIREQMALTPSLLRSRYRKRANPATTEEKQPGVPRTPCEPGSRWQQVALSHDDIGKAIVATGSQIYVAGKFRTDLDPSYELNGLSAPQSCSSVAKSNWVNSGKSCSTEVNKWRCRNSVTWVAELLCQQECFDAGFGYDGDDCSQGWPSLNFEGYVCSVEPAATVGSQLIVSTSSQCGSGTTVMPNPGIHVSGLSQTSAAFSSVRPGVIVLNQTPAPCDFGDFIKVNNLAYRYDSRLKLLDVQAASQETCVAVPKTAFNAEQCAVQAGRVCSVVQATSATLVLNSSTLELISERSGSYVYTVSGLRTSTAPCGTLSRWKLLDCTAVDCTESSFGTSDRQLLVDALGQQQGEYRDIFVSCSNVAANSVISLGGIVFQHVYLHEGKVYDFSAWVTQHPGGASAITKWANTGYELVYPASHDMSRFETALADKNLQYVGPLGEEIRYLSLPTSLQSESLALALAPPTSSEDLSLACPSPGEAANQPSLGNNMPFFMFFPSFSEAEVDLDLDHPSKEFGWSRFARTNAWINQAMEAPDQLRQRVAWALSQILVTGTGGFTYFYQFETWVNYYDILVRGAFGNYLDLLREVTLSPLMGEYLSFFKNSAFDHDQNYPDENYAREVMQLFTVGTVQLNPDGSEVLIGGNPVPTYDNEDIMTFASVLTGFDRQLMRSNLEVVKGSGTGRNLIDPMQMKPEWHDAYPKMDLDDNYLGDGYPLCEDLPKGAFLLKGARFEFLSSQYSSNDVLTVHSSSALFQALCSASGSGGCSFQAVVVLSQDLSCHADECDATIPSVLKVGSAYYEFVPPACVHLYFYNGKIATDGGGSRNWQSKMQCTNPAAFAGGSYCCDGCSNNRPPSWVPDNFCENRSSSSFTSRCSNTDNWVNNKYCELRCFEEGLGYGRDCAVGAYREAHACGVYQEKVPYATAVKYCSSLGMQICDRQTDLTTCGYNDDGARVWTQTNCSINVSVDETGKVSSQKDESTKMNKIRVSWTDGSPDVAGCPADCSSGTSSCVCPVSVEFQAVFDRIPSTQELVQLKVGAFAPSSACASCGDVKAYHAGVIDKETIFEYQGRYYKNVVSLVHVAGKSFRNPPLFGFTETPSSRSAMWEVESLLEHLVTHPNTAPFVSVRLIQRLVSSNPSSEYIRDVSEAFRTGRYGDQVFSGRHGDLAAAVAAVLLHPEASSSSQSRGTLREPLVKLVHFLRATEFVDADRRELIFKELQDLIGQAPFMSPSVFNFYRPDFQPSGLPDGLVAPEAQIFEGANVVNFMNGMLSMIKHGGLSDCDGGLGLATETCGQGQSFTKAWGSQSEALEELNLLLTGGRLTNKSQQIAQAAYEKEGIQAAQEAIVLAPEFNALGDPRPEGSQRDDATEGAPTTTRAPASYKALINLYLGGGADTFNLVVPIDCDLHAEYQAVRKTAAMPSANLLEVSTVGQSCSKFGVHRKLPVLHSLYQEGRAAFVSNIGSLVEPMDKNDYFKGSKTTCAGLFSHSDQSEAAQTLKCQVRGSGPKGVGGRMADSLSQTQNLRTMSFSLNGRQTWAQGSYTSQVGVPVTGEVPTLLNYTGKRQLLDDLTRQKLGNVYCEEYAKSAGALVDSNQALFEQLANVSLMTSSWDAIPSGSEGKLMKTMQAVAKLIVTRTERQVERDFFYVELGGFDTHNEIHEVMDENFDYVNIALEAFVAELKAQGIFDAVTMVSSSDFGRTLTSNGKGTDHGWAGNHFVLGGAVRGGKVLNDYPESLLEGNNQDVGRGRLIPKYPWESLLFPVSEWMGVSPSDHPTIFPNLPNFNSSYILATSTLFD